MRSKCTHTTHASSFEYQFIGFTVSAHIYISNWLNNWIKEPLLIVISISASAGLLPTPTRHEFQFGAESTQACQISTSYLWFVCFGMSLHILHGCERLKSTDDPAQRQTTKRSSLLGALGERIEQSLVQSHQNKISAENKDLVKCWGPNGDWSAALLAQST